MALRRRRAGFGIGDMGHERCQRHLHQGACKICTRNGAALGTAQGSGNRAQRGHCKQASIRASDSSKGACSASMHRKNRGRVWRVILDHLGPTGVFQETCQQASRCGHLRLRRLAMGALRVFLPGQVTTLCKPMQDFAGALRRRLFWTIWTGCAKVLGDGWMLKTRGSRDYCPPRGLFLTSTRGGPVDRALVTHDTFHSMRGGG